MSHQNLEAFKSYQNIYIIGIGGIGISALARILAKEGHQIKGSDLASNKNIDLLIQEGLTVLIGQKAENLPTDTQLVIYTTAIPADNPEFLEAKKRHIKMLSYPQAVGLLTSHYRTICICGTHGKTTTTALLALMLEKNNADPTVIVGSLLEEFGKKNERLGNSPWLVLEACEYQEAFLNYQPEIVILTNIEPEHLDYFKTSENYIEAFRKFIGKIPSHGFLIANAEDKNISKLLSETNWPFQILTYGKNTGNFTVNSFQITTPDQEKLDLNLLIPGNHNRLNATAALAAIAALNFDRTTALQSIENFRGAARRFELKGRLANCTIIDDYGHTPTEIKATLQGVQQQFGYDAKILVVFQPHQYSRTYHFLKDFGTAFYAAKRVLIPNIYRSRDSEDDVARINVDQLVKEINSNSETGDLAINTHDFTETLDYIKDYHRNFDVVITIGAGNITELADQISNIA